MLKITGVLGITAAAMTVAGYLTYTYQTKKGLSRPNPATWSVTVVLTVLYVLFYHQASQDWVMTAQPIVSALACASMFAYDLKKGKFDNPKKLEWIAIAIGVLAIPLIFEFHQLGWSVAIIFIAAGVAFYPTLKGVFDHPENEYPLAWFIWTAAFLVGAMNALLQPEVRIIAVLPPILMAIGHAGIAYLSGMKVRQEWVWPEVPCFGFLRRLPWVRFIID